MTDLVNHPPHYECLSLKVSFKVEPINLYSCYEFCMGCAIQYILRAPHKNNEIEDYQKAIWYLNFLKKIFIKPHITLFDKAIYSKALEIYRKQNLFINTLLNSNGTCSYRNRTLTIKKIKQKIKELKTAQEEVTEVSELIKED